MPETSQLLAFALASILFIQLPGPSLLFTIGRALSVGRRDAMLSVVGNALGLLVQAVLVATGVGALVAASVTAYTVIKVVGAVYVVYLGIQAIRHRSDGRRALEAGAADVAPAPAWSAVRTGLLVGVTNPKTVVFFVAFLPQFVDADAGHTGLQLALLGLLFAVLAMASDTVWALAAARARAWFGRRPARLDALSAGGGTLMIGLGAAMVANE